uniref:Uncharacterized protein n=1 Tax=Oryza sativa subsp. japonica TaxID=39947 RepID=Q6ZBF1_ORYSJ|nr:hypothetical protein [Oryza sativa Japonica Group]
MALEALWEMGSSDCPGTCWYMASVARKRTPSHVDGEAGNRPCRASMGIPATCRRRMSMGSPVPGRTSMGSRALGHASGTGAAGGASGTWAAGLPSMGVCAASH